MKPAVPRLAFFASLLLAYLPPTASCRAEFFEKVATFRMEFDTVAPDVRSRALGGAVAAIPSGPAELWWNPAALPTGHLLETQYAPVPWPGGIEIDLRTAALAGEWRNVRLGLMRTEFEVGPELIRSAYEPEGNGFYLHSVSTVWTFNAGTDLARWILPTHPRANIAIGGSVRRLATSDDFMGKQRVWDADFGLIAAQLWEGQDAWCRVRMAGMVRNAFRSDFTVEGFEADLLRTLRLGVACEVGLPRSAGGRIPVQGTLAYGRDQNPDGFSFYNRDHLGLELTIFDLLSPRVGHADISSDRSPWSYGCGLQIARPGVWPIGLRVDYAREDWGDLGGWRQQWAAGVFAEFD